MDDGTARKELVFLVRLWAEPDGLGPRDWRGRVELVRSHVSRYFTSLDDLSEFIRARQREADDSA